MCFHSLGQMIRSAFLGNLTSQCSVFKETASLYSRVTVRFHASISSGGVTWLSTSLPAFCIVTIFHFSFLTGMLLSHFSRVRLCVTPETRLPRPWDSPGKNTGVGCHFLLQCMKVKSESEAAQSSLILCLNNQFITE